MDGSIAPAELLARACESADGGESAAYYEGARDMVAAVRRAVREYAAEDADMAGAFDRALGFVSCREDAAYAARLAARRFERSGSLDSAIALRGALEEAFSPEWGCGESE